jgi:hypothetical protein
MLKPKNVPWRATLHGSALSFQAKNLGKRRWTSRSGTGDHLRKLTSRMMACPTTTQPDPVGCANQPEKKPSHRNLNSHPFIRKDQSDLKSGKTEGRIRGGLRALQRLAITNSAPNRALTAITTNAAKRNDRRDARMNPSATGVHHAAPRAKTHELLDFLDDLTRFRRTRADYPH